MLKTRNAVTKKLFRIQLVRLNQLNLKKIVFHLLVERKILKVYRNEKNLTTNKPYKVLLSFLNYNFTYIDVMFNNSSSVTYIRG